MKWFEDAAKQLQPGVIYPRSELVRILKQVYPYVSENSYHWGVNGLLKKGLINKVGYDQYMLPTGEERAHYVPGYSDLSRELMEKIIRRFPAVAFVIFETVLMNEFLNHLVAQNTVFIQVEKDASALIFRFLQEEGYHGIMYQLNVYRFVNSTPTTITKVSDTEYQLPARTEPATLRMTNSRTHPLMVPLIVQKQWDLPAGKEYGEGKTYSSAPFKIYGVYENMKTELTAYSVDVPIIGNKVAALRETDQCMVPKDDGTGSELKSWAKMVYVNRRDSNNHNYTSYIVEEPDLAITYPNDAWSMELTPAKAQWEEVTGAGGYTDAYVKVIPTGIAAAKLNEYTSIKRV